MFCEQNVRDPWPSCCRFPAVSNTGLSRWYLILLALVIALLPLPTRAQTPDPQPPGPSADPVRPPLNPFPADQNWSFLADSSKRTDFFDSIKFIPYGDNPAEKLPPRRDHECAAA